MVRLCATSDYEESPMTWIITQSGKRFHPFEPRIDELDIEDIAHSLSLICRWTGHCPFHYSVAQHSVLMAGWAMEKGHSPACQLGCLLHDGAEAYLNDLNRPIKHRLGEFSPYNQAEARIQRLIEERWCAPGIRLDMPTIKSLDNQVLRAEAIQFFGGEEVATWWGEPNIGNEPVAADIVVQNFGLSTWRALFLQTFNRLRLGKPADLLR